MKRKIISITTYRCDYLSGGVNDDHSVKTFRSNFTAYNENEDITKEIHYSKEGDEESVNEYLYDSKGFMIEQQHFEDGELVEKITYDANSDGLIGKEFRHYLDSSFDTIEYEYNGLFLVRKTQFDSDMDIEHVEYFDWEKEKLVKECVKDANGELISEKKYVFDADYKNLLEFHLKDSNDGQALKTVYEYNENDIRTLVKVYDHKDRLLSRSSFLINEKNESVQIVEEDGLKTVNIYIEYDDRGNIIKQEDFNSDEVLIAKFEQTFDDDNLMIEYHAFVDKLGEGVNQNYNLTYDYEFYDEAS